MEVGRELGCNSLRKAIENALQSSKSPEAATSINSKIENWISVKQEHVEQSQSRVSSVVCYL
jgi:hypothetical protein